MDDPEEQRKDKVYCLQNIGVVISPLLNALMILGGTIVIFNGRHHFYSSALSVNSC